MVKFESVAANKQPIEEDIPKWRSAKLSIALR